MNIIITQAVLSSLFRFYQPTGTAEFMACLHWSITGLVHSLRRSYASHYNGVFSGIVVRQRIELVPVRTSTGANDDGINMAAGGGHEVTYDIRDASRPLDEATPAQQQAAW